VVKIPDPIHRKAFFSKLDTAAIQDSSKRSKVSLPQGRDATGEAHVMRGWRNFPKYAIKGMKGLGSNLTLDLNYTFRCNALQ